MEIINKLKYLRSKIFSPLIDRLDYIIRILNEIKAIDLEKIKEGVGRIESRQVNKKLDLGLFGSEFRIFSQWGEDGIIQYLINHLEIDRKIFVEFGVEDYTEANTRFLLTNNNWAGLVIERDGEMVKKIKSSRLYWLYNLKVAQAHITKENINQILLDHGIIGEIGILSIDIDGNDYWVWDAINVIDPVIVIAEYNYRFGSDQAVTIPYDANFDRKQAHHSRIYFGASLKALCLLAEKKGYIFIGCCSNGVNAFFMRQNKKPDFIKSLTEKEGYVEGNFCEYRDINGFQKKIYPESEKSLLTKLDLPLIKVN